MLRMKTFTPSSSLLLDRPSNIICSLNIAVAALVCSLINPTSYLHAAEAIRPNVIFILADDLGWSDTTLYGTTQYYQTPNIERLAKRGMTLTHAYSASPLCSPTRSAILTGLSPARTGITTPNCHLPQVVLQSTHGKSAPADQKVIQPQTTTRLKAEYRTISDSLKDAGYATGHFGKWHLGSEPYSPLEHSFDVDVPHHAGPGPAGSFVAPWKFKDFDHDPNIPDQHLEDRMAKEATAFMEKHRDEPFFMNYWMFSVHAPFDAKRSLIDKHKARTNPKDPQRSPTYAAMVESMDDAVGVLLDTLDRLKIAERTIIIFTSDNGGNMYNEIDDTTPTSNLPLRGGKATMFEGGTRVPGIIAWPGITTPGSRSNTPVQSEDYYRTLLDGLALPIQAGQTFDGVSVLPALKGEAFQRGALFQFFPHSPGVPDWLPPAVSVHRDEWKLIRIFHGGEQNAHRYMLFNLREDTGEQNNLAASKPDLVAELDSLIDQFLANTKAVVPIPNPTFNPSKYHPELEGKQQSKGTPKAKDSRANSTGSAPSLTSATWHTSKDTVLTKNESPLSFKSTGGDPWISTTATPKAPGPFLVTLRLSSNTKGDGVIYFSSEDKRRFHIDQSVSFTLINDGTLHDYEVHVSATDLAAIRLDPGNSPGNIVIEKFDVRDGNGKTTSLLK
jgi:arylsulfatase A-like enzyme